MDFFIFNANIGLVILAFGFFVLNRPRRKAAHLALAACSFTGGLWIVQLGLVGGPVIRDASCLRLTAASMYWTGYAISVALCYFSMLFPTSQARLPGIRDHALLLLPLLGVAYLLFGTDSVIQAAHPERALSDKLVFAPHGNAVYLLLGLANTAWAAVNLARKFRAATPGERRQILAIGLGFLFSYFIGFILDVVGPAMGRSDYVRYSFLITLPFLATGYMIFKYRLLELELALRKAVVYFLVLTGTAAVYAAIFLAAPASWVGQDHRFHLTLVITAALLVILALELKSILEILAGRLSTGHLAAYYQTLNNFTRQLNRVVQRSALLEGLDQILTRHMQASYFGLYQGGRPGEVETWVLQNTGTPPARLPSRLDANHPVVRHLSEDRGYIETEEFDFEYGDLYRGARVLDPGKAAVYAVIHDQWDAAVVLPMRTKDPLNGLLVLGSKTNGQRYTRRELEWLEGFSGNLAMLLENLDLWERAIHDERLAVMSAVTSSLAHEIHNPLSSVKTMVDMLDERRENREFMERFLEIVPREIGRVIELTHKLIAYALPRQPKSGPIWIPDIVQQAVSMLQAKLESGRIGIRIQLDSMPGFMQGDAKLLMQVFYHLILNACQASKPGGEIFVRGTAEGKGLAIRITDHGEGIRPEALAHIYEPFKSTKIYGLGLGLPICKRIVEAHRGTIAIASPEGEGTEATVWLPVSEALRPCSSGREPAMESPQNG